MSKMQLCQREGHWCWPAVARCAELRFYGRATFGEESAIETDLRNAGLAIAYLRQKHTARVVSVAAAGDAGAADALITTRPGLALRIATADCVPILLVGEGVVAAVHAGWRGIAADIVGRTLDQWPDKALPRAVIGPAIGPCCYEVGDDVARDVADASTPQVVVEGPSDQPHLDLHRAVMDQLARAGVDRIDSVPACTRCEPERLWSYRREGPRAGRNLAFVWLSEEAKGRRNSGR
ncbi:MAG: peptidoglycan editing factor PgeF [Acidobacteriota bacterium]|nr:peptidoglycan editing factor PgeF [Acidobacteriota bacterium]